MAPNDQNKHLMFLIKTLCHLRNILCVTEKLGLFLQNQLVGQNLSPSLAQVSRMFQMDPHMGQVFSTIPLSRSQKPQPPYPPPSAPQTEVQSPIRCNPILTPKRTMPVTDTQLTDIDRAHAFTQAAGEREKERVSE